MTEKDALVAMAEFICAFEAPRLPADANLPKISYLLTGQIALHHCLARVFLNLPALLTLRMVIWLQGNGTWVINFNDLSLLPLTEQWHFLAFLQRKGNPHRLRFLTACSLE